MKKVLKKIGLLIAAAIVIMQFFRIDKSVPEMNEMDDFISQTNPPEKVKVILKNACYDCHSYKTQYPWYSNIAPVSWWLKDHIDEGREHLNFSIWRRYDLKRKKHKLEECWEEVEHGEMPLENYLYTHEEALLTKEEKETLITWFKSLYADPVEEAPVDEKSVVLNDGQKWEANIETTRGIANMSDLINADFDVEDLEKHLEIAANLNAEIRTIFSSCTMKGEAHEQLHNYILPLVTLCNDYEKSESIDEAKTLNQRIQLKVSAYGLYFK